MASDDVIIHERTEMDNMVCFVVCIIDFVDEIFCDVMLTLTGLLTCRTVFESATAAVLSI